MMSRVDLLRKLTQALIAQDPVAVTITRSTVEADEFGGASSKSEVLGPQTVRLFLSRLGHREITRDGGTREVQTLGLLAEYDADIQCTSTVTDTFALPGRGRFEVVSVVPVMHGGEVVALQCELKEVS